MGVKVRYRFRFYPSEDQAKTLAQVFGCCRYVYNRALRLRADAWATAKKNISYNETSAALTEWKKQPESVWLTEVSCVPTQQSLRHLNNAFVRFFNKEARFPTFKKKTGKQTAEYTASAFKWDARNRNLSLSGLGRLDIHWSREFSSVPTTVTVTRSAGGRYFATLCLDEHFAKLSPTGNTVGVDLGINRLATLSNGERIPSPKHTIKNQDRLARAQRALARKTKGSGRRRRACVRIARIQEHIANCRKDHLDKATTRLVRRFDVISLEDLNVRGMVQNHSLARSISDAGFGQFRQMLTYKCERYGRELRLVDRFFPSSKRCSACGHILESLALATREWTCPKCETKHDRDENAARNIHTAGGQPVAARGAKVRRFKPSGLKRTSLRNVNQSEHA